MGALHDGAFKHPESYRQGKSFGLEILKNDERVKTGIK